MGQIRGFQVGGRQCRLADRQFHSSKVSAVFCYSRFRLRFSGVSKGAGDLLESREDGEEQCILILAMLYLILQGSTSSEFMTSIQYIIPLDRQLSPYQFALIGSESIIIMSMIEAVTISGFRSFSPHSYQVIDFAGGLTLIAGKSGTGKSTILQVLNYSLTGSFPCKKEISLVTDPRILDKMATQAQARLKFRSSNGHPFITCRVLCNSTAKRAAKQSVLSFKHTGIQHDLVYSEGKTKEMDEIILQLLNTTKSFIDCVVFGHQAQEQVFFTNLSLNFFDLFGLRQFGEIVEGFQEMQNAYQMETGRLRRSMFNSKKLYEHDIEMKRSSLAVLESISEEYVKQEPAVKTDLNESATGDMKKRVPRKRKGKNKGNSEESTEAEIKQQGNKLSSFPARKQEMDLAANIAFQEYKRPLEMQYLHLKLHISYKQQACQDIQNFIRALYASLNELLNQKIALINQAVNQIWSELYDGDDIASISIVFGADSTHYKKDRVSFSFLRPGSKVEQCMTTHCSPTQLALASIAIRIALVEVLSPKGRLLVLDDPSVALAPGQTRRLAKYIGKLAESNEIQLIIASSDCHFVSLVEQYASSHYQVSMRQGFFSAVGKKGVTGYS